MPGLASAAVAHETAVSLAAPTGERSFAVAGKGLHANVLTLAQNENDESAGQNTLVSFWRPAGRYCRLGLVVFVRSMRGRRDRYFFHRVNRTGYWTHSIFDSLNRPQY